MALSCQLLSVSQTNMEVDKRAYILQRLKLDVLAVDMQWSLFVAALHSYRRDSVLRPFPASFDPQSPHTEKDYEKLENLAKEIPAWDAILAGALDQCSDQFVDLLHWVIQGKRFALQACPRQQYDTIKDLTKQVVKVTDPDYVFEVVYSKDRNQKFEELQANRDLLYAYHGSRLDNFHSIIHHGLHSHLNKTSLFGEGTYLSSELSVSIPYSPTGAGWIGSWLGIQMSCVAVCEVIDDPSSVKCQLKENEEDKNNSLRQRSNARAKAPGSMAGEVPEKYYIVRNNDVLRVKYILVYITQKPKKRCDVSSKSRLAWLMSHKFAVVMIIYAVILLIIGLYNSRNFQIMIRRYMR